MAALAIHESVGTSRLFSKWKIDRQSASPSSLSSWDFCSVGKKPGKAINIVTLCDRNGKSFSVKNFPTHFIVHILQLKLKIARAPFIETPSNVDIFIFHRDVGKCSPPPSHGRFDSVFHDATRSNRRECERRVYVEHFVGRPFSSFHISRYWATEKRTQTFAPFSQHISLAENQFCLERAHIPT